MLQKAENESITWKFYMWNLPVLKFAVNSSIDALPTFTNLRRWGKCASVNCQLCRNMVKQTLFHVLVHCKHIETVDLEAAFHPESHRWLPEVCPCGQECGGAVLCLGWTLGPGWQVNQG
jgi:hypothetical protein